jgi:tryptophan synthase alpha chain
LLLRKLPYERIAKLDELSNGFLYAVSSSSTTGSDKNMNDVGIFLQRLKSMKLKNPIMVGFGIKDKQSFQAACQYADGAIIGTAYIKAIENAEDVNTATKSFLSSILG